MDTNYKNKQIRCTMDSVDASLDRFARADIRYVHKGNKSAVKFLNRIKMASPLSFGELITDEPYRKVAEKAIYDISFDIMNNTVRNVCRGMFPKDEGTFYQEDGAVEEINKRLVPSHINWMNSRSGQAPLPDGSFSDPTESTSQMERLLSSDRYERKAAFDEYASRTVIDRISSEMVTLDAEKKENFFIKYSPGATIDEEIAAWKRHKQSQQ